MESGNVSGPVVGSAPSVNNRCNSERRINLNVSSHYLVSAMNFLLLLILLRLIAYYRDHYQHMLVLSKREFQMLMIKLR